MINDDHVPGGDPECRYKFLEARVSSSIDPSAAVDVACFMTTDAVDSDDEVVLPAGADLSRFEKNPVLMLCHAYGQPGSYYPLPIGKVVWTKKRPHGLMAGVAFARSTPIGREVKGLFDEDMCRSFSIGFRSLESSLMTREEARSRPDWKAAFERLSGRILVHRKWLLLELSVAPIPSNEDALRAKYAARGLPIPSWIQSTPAREANMTAADSLGAFERGAATPRELTSPETVKCGEAPIAKGDAVEWTRKGGGCGLVKSVHTKGSHPEDEDVDESELLDASPEEPVARVKCYRKAAGGYVETDSMRSLHCKHLKRMSGGLPAAGREEVKALVASEEPEAGSSPVRTHDFVKINAPHHKGHGLVKSVHDSGMVPDVEDDILGTRENPAARVKCYKAVGDGYVATDHHVGHYCKHLETVSPLPPPSKTKPSGKGLRHASASSEALPPLVVLTEQQVVKEAIAKLNLLLSPDSIQRMIAEELEMRMGSV